MKPPVLISDAWRPARALLLACALGSCAESAAPVATGDPTIQLVVSQLSSPLFVTTPPGDTARLFVVEQTGRIRIVRADTLLTRPFLDLSALVSCCGEQGLLGLAFHPQYAANGRFYVDYTDAAGNTQVVRYQVSSDPDSADASSASPVLSQTQPFSNHNGGMLVFGPDGMLYIGLGDGGSGGDPLGNGQSLGTWLGKILRIDVSGAGPYAVPPNNPFVGQAGVKPEIWAYGLRNPWRFSFDRLTGDLYIGDVGQNLLEEIDVETAPSAGGRNYGWNVMEGKSCYATATCDMTGLTLPALDYPHTQGCSITGGYVYRGTRLPALAGTYFFSDYCSGWIHSIRVENGGTASVTNWPRLAPGGAISAFGEDGRGELYVVSYQPGAVFRVVPANP